MRILFAVNAPPDQLTAAGTALASARYRGVIPAQELGRQPGVSAATISFLDLFRPGFGDAADMLVLHQPKADICRLAKAIPALLANIDRQRQRGCRFVIDVSDFKFDSEHDPAVDAHFGPGAAALYRRILTELFGRADAVTAPTRALADLLKPHLRTGMPIRVIEDLTEVTRGAPRFSPDAPLRLLWFGWFGSHQQAMRSFLQNDLDEIGRQVPVMLRLLCEKLPPEVLARNAGPAAARHRIEMGAWSLPALEAALADCDIVVLPFATSSALSIGKSNNRALQALYAGRYVVAHPIDSYRPLSEFCGLDMSLPKAISAALADPAAALDRIRRGQTYVEQHYTPAAIARDWHGLASDIAGAKPATAP